MVLLRAALRVCVLAGLAVASIGCGSQWTGSYRAITLDDETLIIRPAGFIKGGYGVENYPLGHSYYQEGTMGGGYEINHWERRTSPPHFIAYDFFRLDRDRRLIQRTKVQELFRGAFGIAVLETLYRYESLPEVVEARGWENKGTNARVRVIPGDTLRVEPPMVSEGASRSAGEPPAAISFIRVVRFEPGTVIVSARYGADGGIRAVGTARDGDGQLQSKAYVTPDGTHINERGIRLTDRTMLELFAVPPAFPVVEFRNRPHRFWDEAAYADVVSVVVYHGELNRSADRYVFRGTDGAVERSSLSWRVTNEDKLLEPYDRTATTYP